MDIISLLQRARYFLTATFVSYNNSLHSYWNTENDTGSCCDGNDFPTNCTGHCYTVLQYCFKDYGTENNISNDHDQSFITGCIGRTGSSGLLQEAADYIDYSMSPLTVANRATLSVLTLLNDDAWPVS